MCCLLCGSPKRRQGGERGDLPSISQASFVHVCICGPSPFGPIHGSGGAHGQIVQPRISEDALVVGGHGWVGGYGNFVFLLLYHRVSMIHPTCAPLPIPFPAPSCGEWPLRDRSLAESSLSAHFLTAHKLFFFDIRSPFRLLAGTGFDLFRFVVQICCRGGHTHTQKQTWMEETYAKGKKKRGSISRSTPKTKQPDNVGAIGAHLWIGWIRWKTGTGIGTHHDIPFWCCDHPHTPN